MSEEEVAGETPVHSEACVSRRWSGKEWLHIGQLAKWLPLITRGRFDEDLVLRLVENMDAGADAGADRLAPFEPKNDVKDFCLGGAILSWNEHLSVASRDGRALVVRRTSCGAVLYSPLPSAIIDSRQPADNNYIRQNFRMSEMSLKIHDYCLSLEY